MSDGIKLICNPFRDETYTSQLESEECREFHQTLPNYSKTPLIELNDLSNDLQSKIEEYSSVKKEKDHEYFLKKRFERRLREAKFHENASSIEKPMVGRKSPLSPTAFGCD